MPTVSGCQLRELTFFQIERIDLACSGCRSRLVIQRLGCFVDGIQCCDIYAFRRKDFLLNALTGKQIGTTPTVFLTQRNKTVVTKPLPFVKKAIVHKLLFAFFPV